MMTTGTATKKEKKFRGIVVINHASCKGCAFCVEFCPTKALALEKGFNAKGYHPPYLATPELCNGCDMCGLFCPDFAIFGYREKLEQAA
ncbi:MAG: 4Fe-4S ferredoxin [Anaeromyxobacter sp. RBG_16_69_14]|jgi:2-oxoglutarate ferredoxin oxidoreductase subunit delta|nr:MAG: 4Fe-4S ferredoxin [Anaeromyxobacter sp. RBG_16_69_14]